ncbi:MAG TPA: prepilin-type N-terminal cleavage/methylation domain-containing protein, partial [Geobacteraceae bacterium]|nr:prepilin-type N-terminal cleavage/methylation domain-containing protein [Geobacteraceae bacterium]
MQKLDSRSRSLLVQGEQGFSLTELIVVMAIFLTIMLITSSTFKTIVNQSSQQSKSIETQIEGIVGLEVLRSDMEQAGFGLPWSFQNTPVYAESVLGS